MVNILMAFTAGILVIVSMIINSNLAKEIGTFQGTFVNYSVGLFFSTLVFIISGSWGTINGKSFMGLPAWAYVGGALGVVIVCISNIIIPKIPTIYTTLLIFTGQLFSGILIDYFREDVISKGKIIGGLLILSGMGYNFYVDKSENKLQTVKTSDLE